MKWIISLLLLVISSTVPLFAQHDPVSAEPYTTLGNVKRVFNKGKLLCPVVTMKEILADPKVRISRAGYNVVSYEITIIPTDLGYPVGPFRVLGGDLTPQVMQALRDNAGMSGKILVDRVKAQDPGGEIKYYNSIELEYRN